MSLFYGKKGRLTKKQLKETAHRARSIKRYGTDGLIDQLNDFKYYSCEITDFICEKVQEVKEMQVYPNVIPGTLRTKFKGIIKWLHFLFYATTPKFFVINFFFFMLDCAPEEKESMEVCLNDFENHILPITLHWKHQNFYAYYPGGNGFANIIGDMLSTALGGIGFSWVNI